MRITIESVRPWSNGSLCAELDCKTTCYDDCVDCKLGNGVPAALEIRIKLSPADGSAEQQELLNRLKSVVDSLNQNGKPAKSIQMTLFERR